MTYTELINLYSVDLVKANPHKLYVFGDNTKRMGCGGQAVIRHCINSFGIVTKYNPDNRDISFFSEKPSEFSLVLNDILKLKDIRDSGVYKAIVFPTSGLGTGLSQLPKRSPRLLNFLNTSLDIIFTTNYSSFKGYI